MAIMYPLHSTRVIREYWRALLGSVWAVGAGLGVPQYMHSHVIVVSRTPHDMSDDQSHYNCAENWDATSAHIYSIVLFALTYGVPVICLSIFYGFVAFKIARATLPGNRSAGQDEIRRQVRTKVRLNKWTTCKS